MDGYSLRRLVLGLAAALFRAVIKDLARQTCRVFAPGERGRPGSSGAGLSDPPLPIRRFGRKMPPPRIELFFAQSEDPVFILETGAEGCGYSHSRVN